MPSRLAVLATFLVLVSATCGGSGPPSFERSSVPATLAGSAWTAVLVAGKPIVAASPPTATFDGETIDGTNGCNGYGGPYRYAAGAFTVGEVISTAMGCEAPIAEVERRFMAALQAATTVSIDADGRMIMNGPGGSIVFEVAPRQAG